VTPAVPARQDHRITLGVLTTAAMAFALSQTMVIPALPHIQADLGASTTATTWILTVYLLTASVATPILGRLGDMFGKERVLVAVLAVFALGSLIAAVSSSIETLVAGRAIQGVGGAIFPLAFGIIRDEFPRERVGTGIGLISATFGIGGGAGLVLSGVIVDHLSFAWIFWLALIVTLGAIVATHRYVPASPVRTPSRVDWPGALLLSAGLVALLVAVSEGERWGWTSAATVGLLAVAAAVLVWWVRFELRTPEPMVEMRMLRDRTVATTNLAALLVGFGMFGSFILIPQFVQAVPAEAGYGFGVTVTGAALFLLPSAALTLIGGPISGALGTRFGPRVPLLMGTLTSATSYAFLAVAHDERWHIYVGSALLGLGIGLAFAAMANLIVEAVRQDQTGIATGMNTIFRTIGGALGGQLAASIVAASAVGGGLPTAGGFTTAFALSAVGVAGAFGAALAIPARRPGGSVAAQRPALALRR
jgi:EmrB/QacA subfamily drug resistance transporter